MKVLVLMGALSAAVFGTLCARFEAPLESPISLRPTATTIQPPQHHGPPPVPPRNTIESRVRQMVEDDLITLISEAGIVPPFQRFSRVRRIESPIIPESVTFQLEETGDAELWNGTVTVRLPNRGETHHPIRVSLQERRIMVQLTGTWLPPTAWIPSPPDTPLPVPDTRR